MSKRKAGKTDKRKIAIRILCIFLAILMISSTLLAIFGIIEI